MTISKQGAKRAGKVFEWSVRRDLRENGYHIIVSAGSLTATDMVAIKTGEILFVQCKAGVASTSHLIKPAERAELWKLATAINRPPWITTARAVVAHQVKNSRAHQLRYYELIGTKPKERRPWTPDEVGRQVGVNYG